jgi:predicted nucleic-acid-binding protein
MKALDTNVLVRFLTGDDPEQAKKVFNLLTSAEKENSRLFIPVAVILETIWVLESAYEIPRDKIVEAISDILLLPILEFEQHNAIQKLAVKARKVNTDLADLLIGIVSIECGCDKVLTFDKKASRSEYFELII